MLLIGPFHDRIAVFRRVQLPAARVRARPVAIRARPGVERHAQACTCVEPRAAYFSEVPVRPEVTCAHFGIRFETPASKHHRFRADFARFTFMQHRDAGHAIRIAQQTHRGRFVQRADAILLSARVQRVDQARAAAPHDARQAAPELHPAVDLGRLPPESRFEAHAFAAQPDQRIETVIDHVFDELGVASILGHARHVIEELRGGIRAEIGVADIFVSQVRDNLCEVINAVECDAHLPACISRVAAAIVFRRRVDQQHRRARFLRCERSARGGVASAYDYDVNRFHHTHCCPSP